MIAFFHPTRSDRFIEGQRNGSSGSISKFINIHINLVHRQPHSMRRRLDNPDIESFIDKTILLDVIDYETGEILIEKDSKLDLEALQRIQEIDVKSLKFLKQGPTLSPEVINKTLRKEIYCYDSDKTQLNRNTHGTRKTQMTKYTL